MKRTPKIVLAAALLTAAATCLAAIPTALPGTPLREQVETATVTSVTPSAKYSTCRTAAASLKCAGILPHVVTFKFDGMEYKQYVVKPPAGSTVIVHVSYEAEQVLVPGSAEPVLALRLYDVSIAE